MGVKDEAGGPALGQQQPANFASSLARHQAKHCSWKGLAAGSQVLPAQSRGQQAKLFMATQMQRRCPAGHLASHLVGQRIFVSSDKILRLCGQFLLFPEKSIFLKIETNLEK